MKCLIFKDARAFESGQDAWLARYMRILPRGLWTVFRTNHQCASLLPAFPGADPYRQAMERGVAGLGTAHTSPDPR